MKTKGDGVEVIYIAGLFVCAVVAAFVIIKMQDERLFGNRSRLFEKIRAIELRQTDAEKTINSNILTVAKANMAISEVKKDLVCFTAKLDKNDAELDNLQEHCVKLRESIIDVKEVVASKRPVIRMPEIKILLPTEVFRAGELKKVKAQIKELAK